MDGKINNNLACVIGCDVVLRVSDDLLKRVLFNKVENFILVEIEMSYTDAISKTLCTTFSKETAPK